MKVTGIVCEYNPFHNGHEYHISETKKQLNSDYIIGIMSGCFTQRGTPAIIDKYSRTYMALQGGCDIVIELPVRYATSSAEGFAAGAVGTLAATGICESICFGSEDGNLDSMYKIASVLHDEPGEYKHILSEELKSGISYPAAREHALAAYLKTDELFSYEPNNILGLEYIKACMDIPQSIRPYTIKRSDSGYHASQTDARRSPCKSDSVSAEYIRNLILNMPDNTELSVICDIISPYVPSYTLKQLDNIVDPKMYTKIIYYSLLTNINKLESYADMSGELARRIKNNINNYHDTDSFIKLIKTKNYTYTRIERAIMHCVLGIEKKDFKCSKYPIPYIRVLGFKNNSSELMKQLQHNAGVPVITRPAKDNGLDETGLLFLEEDIRAADIYSHILHLGTKHGAAALGTNEFTHGVIIA